MENHEIEILFEAVEEVLGVTKEQIVSGKRTGDVMAAKSIMIWLMKGTMTMQRMAKLIGLQSHATVLQKIRKMEGWIETDSVTKFETKSVEDCFKNKLAERNNQKMPEIEELIAKLNAFSASMEEKLQELRTQIIVNYEKRNTTGTLEQVHELAEANY